MKVVFVIAVMGHGKGGHFNSLDHISKSMNETMDVAIMSIGPGASPILSNHENFYKHLYFNTLNLFAFRKKFLEIIKNVDPDILHFFDVNSYLVAQSLFLRTRAEKVVNLCGGPNPSSFPSVDNLILFSQENKNWFEHNSKFNASNIHLIPNRANPIIIKKYPQVQKIPGSFNFVRIARIGKAYRKSIWDSIALISLMRKHYNHNVNLFIIGTVQDDIVYKALNEHIANQEGIHLITDDIYTNKASKMLYLADAVIATGRGVMEGASLGIPVLTPSKNSELPVLITSDNFSNLFSTNFSERNEATPEDLKVNVENISRLITDIKYYQENSELIKQKYIEYFDVRRCPELYKVVYQQAFENKKKVSSFSDINLKLKTFYSFYIKSR